MNQWDLNPGGSDDREYPENHGDELGRVPGC